MDKELIARKITLISADLTELRSLGEKPAADFLASKIDQVLAERYLERMIGRMIDINFHIITEAGHPPPPDYFQSFLRLGALSILPADFARRLAPCAGLRNRLVHEYDEIEPVKLLEGLQTALKETPLFVEHIAKLIE